MARKRPAFDVPDIEPRGIRAVLRPPEEIAAEAERLQQRDSAGSAGGSAPPARRTNGRTDERTVVRHSFDIYKDQLQALTRIQTELFDEIGRKPTMGELAQEAFDLYIASKTGRANE